MLRYRQIAIRSAGLFVLAALFAVLAPANPTRAAPTAFAFPGNGWGHGVGLSQYGAREQAVDGRSWTSILTHYYRGTAIGGDDVPAAVRVQLVDPVAEVKVDAPARFAFRGPLGTTVATSNGGDGTWKVRKDGSGQYSIFRPNGTRAAGPYPTSQRMRIIYEDWSTVVHLAQPNARYRWGHIEMSMTGDRFRMVLEIALERYLRGIAEMPASWPNEALKAQATAARTYAAHRALKLGHHRSGCDCTLFGDTRDQVYRGYEREDPAVSANARWLSAISHTAGKVVTYESDPILASYHSSSGGRTEASVDVWGSDLPYLRSVDDGWSMRATNPYARWETKLSQKDVAARLGVGRVDAIEIRSRTAGGAIKEARILGDATKTMSGSTLRSKLGLRSNKFSVRASVEAVWSSWQRVQTATQSNNQSPALAATPDKAVHALITNTSNVPYYSRRDPSSQQWSSWQRVGPAGTTGTEPGLAADTSGAIHAILRDPTGHVLIARRASNGAWSSWQRIGHEGQKGYEPAISSSPDGSIWVVMRGFAAPSVHATRRATNGSWSGWSKVGDNGYEPAVVGLSSGQAMVVARAADLAVKSSKFDGGWSPWTRISATGGTGYWPALARGPDGKVVLVIASSDKRQLYSATRSGGTWSGWSRVPGGPTELGAAPSVVVDSKGVAHTFVRGPTNVIFTSTRTNSGWIGFYRVGSESSRAGNSSVIAVTSIPGRVFALLRGLNGGLYWSNRTN